MDNANFKRDQNNFFKNVEGGIEHVGQIPEIEKFVQFLGDILEKDDRTPEISQMESVREQLRDKIITKIKEFKITEESLKKEIKKRKSWTVPGKDGTQISDERGLNHQKSD